MSFARSSRNAPARTDGATGGGAGRTAEDVEETAVASLPADFFSCAGRERENEEVDEPALKAEDDTLDEAATEEKRREEAELAEDENEAVEEPKEAADEGPVVVGLLQAAGALLLPISTSPAELPPSTSAPKATSASSIHSAQTEPSISTSHSEEPPAGTDISTS